uniref:Reverse transcriptase zinc-binding domain-containing protein n=1 Tax=Ananas comosus var. bracteatus TaxID=296719 RepID=A0A6V7PY52_ANACO|nr:unnamed protein product [Ananas comosus var. bracteatus]
MTTADRSIGENCSAEEMGLAIVPFQGLQDDDDAEYYALEAEIAAEMEEASARGGNCNVSVLIREGKWHRPHQNSPDLNALWPLISAVEFPANGPPDRVVWTKEPSDRFSFRSAWDLIRTHHPSVPWSNLIWHKDRIPRHAFTAWKALMAKLLTQTELKHRGFQLASYCSLYVTTLPGFGKSAASNWDLSGSLIFPCILKRLSLDRFERVEVKLVLSVELLSRLASGIFGEKAIEGSSRPTRQTDPSYSE